ncbi:hypothetical protein M569_00564, partial [Genlisea aurea]
LSFMDADPKKFVGLQCKVYWPLDAVWYCGQVACYSSETGRHMIRYEDGEEENLILSKEQIKFFVSLEQTQRLKLKLRNKCLESDGLDVSEMMVLAASLDDCLEIETGDVIWAKLTGYAIWPAIVLDESHVSKRKDLNKISGEKTIVVQFFGTHDFARVKCKQVISFLKGLLSSYHSKCSKPTFVRGLEEAKIYLSERRLPERMLKLRNCGEADVNNSADEQHQDGFDSRDEDCVSQDKMSKKINSLQGYLLEVGDLKIISLGRIVKDSSNFQNDRFIWPEGYTVMRRFPSLTDPSSLILYKMEVLRDVESKMRPLFRVTTDTGEEFNGLTPSSCWNEIYKRMQTAQIKSRGCKFDQHLVSGSSMFGFSHPKISKLIKEMSDSISSSKSSLSKKSKGILVGYRRVHVEWRDLDKCNVCHMDEEYESNLFLQCDKCRMMVHARCYGEHEITDDALWLCNFCRPEAPEVPPPCCLCPVVGGAMKPTTDGRWAHLACAIWIPETCLSDIKKMEPIDGINRISKDRWKLLCSICNVSHGACIQCSNYNCCVAYHPLCARAAGFCLETENKDRHLFPVNDDDDNQSIQLLSFCKRHRPFSSERLTFNEHGDQKIHEDPNYISPANPSGCARAEPYTFLGKRQRTESEVTDAPIKRMYVENVPYLLGGCSPHMPLWNKSSDVPYGSVDLQKLLNNSRFEPSGEILSVADKYNFMRQTYRKRLAFGKSRIHGFGVFTELYHRAGDMVIEYTGELIRPVIADRREHLFYDSLVGAGTYMFRIDDDRVIDATRAGSIAQLINHSCDPNCYSRVISVNGDDHIIIFAKRDLKQWEELTYDYR